MISAFLIGLVRLYRYVLSPWIGQSCRFVPTCSVYAIEAIQTHGAFRGLCLAIWRILRCHPFCKGGHDPVPPVRDSQSDPDKSAPPCCNHHRH